MNRYSGLFQHRIVLAEGHHIGDELQVHPFGDIHLTPVGIRGEDRAIVGRNLRGRHKGIRNGQHDGHQEQDGESGSHDSGQRDFRRLIPLPAHGQLPVPLSGIQGGRRHFFRSLFHPSTSFPKRFSAMNRTPMITIITKDIRIAAADSVW